METRILGIQVKDRQNDAAQLQQVLTNYGCFIKTRLGLHEMSAENCSSKGLIILELTGSPEDMQKVEDKIKALKGLDVQKMVFNSI
ncbi:MAG: hypothetical protein JXB49_16830 [Bacteroidales bacterium]|nr:hypothetical protein [Bacteroidales bacterium]